VILPGEMKEILNKVTEAKKAAEASLITRREETAAMRSQANTARIFEGNPTLMRLKELETPEKIADKAKPSVVLADKGLTEGGNLPFFRLRLTSYASRLTPHALRLYQLGVVDLTFRRRLGCVLFFAPQEKWNLTAWMFSASTMLVAASVIR